MKPRVEFSTREAVPLGLCAVGDQPPSFGLLRQSEEARVALENERPIKRELAQGAYHAPFLQAQPAGKMTKGKRNHLIQVWVEAQDIVSSAGTDESQECFGQGPAEGADNGGRHQGIADGPGTQDQDSRGL